MKKKEINKMPPPNKEKEIEIAQTFFSDLDHYTPEYWVAEEAIIESSPAIHSAVREILLEIGEDPDREGLQKTPDRFTRMLAELTAGYKVDPNKLVNGALFEVDYNEIVLVRDIEFYSMCEHHILPFYGRVHVAYIPNGKIIGLSKIPRIVEMYARRLQVQERMTSQIANFLQELLNPLGVAVLVEGSHMCSMMRGVRKSQATMVTRALLGEFQDNASQRAEFLSLVGKPSADVGE
jgi:GTP cyclohydrolase I